MPAKKYIALTAGELTEVAASVASTGAADDGKLVALDATGRIDSTMMPTGIGADTKTGNASEALTAGRLVNFHDVAGVTNVRHADASNGREAHGYVAAGFALNAVATVFKDGTISGLTGLVAGTSMFLGTAGASTVTPPTTAGHISQRVGVALDATSMDFEASRKVTLA